MKKQLLIKYGVSKGRDTYGYNLVTLYADGEKVARTCGGGYDMKGTVLGEYITNTYLERLKSLTANYGSLDKTPGFYGLRFYDKDTHERHNTYHENDIVYIDGACGWTAVEHIMNEIGLTIEYLENLTTKDTSAYLLTDTIKQRLEYLRTELRAERMSYSELAELQSLAEHIEDGDVELLEAAGVPEFTD